jgi:acetyl-CoA C-acetyltransferase
MTRNVAVVGVGQTPFTRACGVSIRELAFDAYKEALDDARNLVTKEIDASIICSAPEYDKQRSPAGLIAEYLGLNPQPTFCIEAICASSTVGIRSAWALISSGLHDIVAVIGFQKMSELTSAESQERMLRGGDIVWESPFGPTMPSYYAMLAQAHINKFGTTEEQLALVRKKSSGYGATNHKAMFQKEVTVEQVLTSKVISSPLKLFDCCSNADGASCTILASDKVARKINDTPIWITGLGLASASMTLAGRETYTSLTCARNAAQQAYKMAKIEPKQVDVAQVHDCFTVAEILAYEDLDFCARGEGGKLIQNGETYVGGKIPVNTDGGLLSKGHPIGATGGSHVRTIVRQLRGEAGSTQVNNAEIGLVHNVGGAGIYGSVLILRR